MDRFSFDAAEWKTLQKLTSPARIQQFLDHEIGYNKTLNGLTCFSPRMVLRDRVAHCMEGALFAAAALRVHGFEPLLVDLEATRDDDHVLAVFRERGHWGAIAKSNYSGLRFREPVYRTIRELALSYFEHYFNLRREKTLRGYSRPINLRRFDRIEWMTTEEHVWEVPTYLCEIPHIRLLTTAMERRLNRMDHRTFAAGCLGAI